MKRTVKSSRILWIVTLMAATASPTWGHVGGGNSTWARPRPDQKEVRETEGTASGPLKDSDYLAYAQAVETTVSSGNLAAFNALIDWDSIFKTMATGWDLSDSMRQELFQGLRQELGQESGFSAKLINNSKQGGALTFLRTRQNLGRQVVLFRMIKPISRGGVNYFEFVPQRAPDGQVRAADIYLHASGGFISSSLRSALLPSISNQSRTFVDKLPTGEKAYVKDYPRWIKAVELSNQSKPQEALAIFKNLSPETQRRKLVLMERLQAALSVDEKEYVAVLDDFRKLYPDDACLELISIDSYLLKKKFTEALKAIDRLDKSLGGDPYLNVTRAGISEATRNLEEAKRFARRAIDQEPRLTVAYLALVGYSLREENYVETLTLLKEMDQKLHTKFKDLSNAPFYAGFVKSPQYRQWLAYLGEKDQPQNASPARQPDSPPRNIRGRPGMPKSGS